LHGCNIRYVDLDEDYRLPEAFFAETGRLCFLARPNAPSGVCVTRAEAERLCQSFPGIVVIDEAYVDFADDNCMDFPKRFENAIVMRTFSKSFSLAGMRIGTAVARPELIDAFLKTKDSYNMNVASQTAGLAAIRDYGYMLENAARIRATRTRLREALIERSFRVPDSQSNFLLAHWTGTPGARAIFEALAQRKIFVRYFKVRRLEDALRITVGSDSECDALLGALDEILA
jgi:histidinol-phosphate aminotransferase